MTPFLANLVSSGLYWLIVWSLAATAVWGGAAVVAFCLRRHSASYLGVVDDRGPGRAVSGTRDPRSALVAVDRAASGCTRQLGRVVGARRRASGATVER